MVPANSAVGRSRIEPRAAKARPAIFGGDRDAWLGAEFAVAQKLRLLARGQAHREASGKPGVAVPNRPSTRASAANDKVPKPGPGASMS